MSQRYSQYTNAIQMLYDRGVPEGSIPVMSITEYTSITKVRDNVEIRGDSETESYWVMFRDSIKKDNIIVIIDNIKHEIEKRLAEGNDKIMYIILVTTENLPHQTKSMINDINIRPDDDMEKYMHFQHFISSFLNFNPTLNELVPKHILLNAEQGLKFVRAMKIEPKHIPKIRVDMIDRDSSIIDAQAKWYGIKKDQIVLTKGHSEAAGIRNGVRIGA